MGRWYRRRKRLNLECLLRDSGCEFVFDASQTSADELLELQARFASVYDPSRLLRDGWRGIVVLPGDARQRREALTLFFMQQLRYRISHPNWASQYRGDIPPFLLDLTKTPATITPAELGAQQQKIEK